MSNHRSNRRTFIKQAGLASAGVLALGPQAIGKSLNFPGMEQELKISLAQWSYHRTIQGGDMTNLMFAEKARACGIEAIEYVNRFFNGGEKRPSYLKKLNNVADVNGIKQLLIMVDGEGDLASSSSKDRDKAIENHFKWVEAAKELGCHSIRVNAAGSGTREEWHKQAVEGLSALSQFAMQHEINVVVENHGGLSSDGAWLIGVINEVNMDNCGTLPDFGNFCIEHGKDGCANEYDRYKGMEELLPKAFAVSAKSHDFDDEGNEIHTDYKRMIDLVKASGYSGYIGVEYEGKELSEQDGIMATKALLERYI